ncbi:TetR family transcriptional regulator [Streptomyces tateyamensis]|uniref:TetR family transcriptional regulator n=1 Tax=Streptomyces tateyamensis TaxID=565073 RepID=A0A2V4PIT5_9ACTN|nr:TetR-like C-terminal domain-containing protein [Streptomyces tateyamensis]PYC83800.1 TetR family transcriptional regulator [Streptomyces tateyamensis]
MPRAGLNPDAVVDHALALIDEQGPEALTLAGVAQLAGVAAPSLYKHVPGGLGGLRRLVAVRVTEELAERLSSATEGLAGEPAVQALLRAYHGYALEHPQRYAALPQSPMAADEQLAGAATALVGAIFKVVEGYGIEDSEAVHAVRTVRALAHGFAALSIGGAFQLSEQLSVTQDRLIAVLTAGLRDWPTGGM